MDLRSKAEPAGTRRLRLLVAPLCLGLAVCACGGSGKSAIEPNQKATEPGPERTAPSLGGGGSLSSPESLTRLAAEPEVQHAVQKFYEVRQDQPAWVGEGRAGAARELLTALAEFDWMGPPPDLPALAAAAGRCDREARAPACFPDLELALTTALVRAGREVAEGAVTPAEAGIGWELPPRLPDLGGVLANGLEGAGPAMVLASLEDQPQLATALRGRRERCVRAVAAGGWPAVPERWASAGAAGGSASLAPGDAASRDFLRALGGRLAAEGYWTAATAASEGIEPVGAEVASVYGEELAAAVRRFQDDYGLEVDGKLGRATVRELNLPAAARLAQVEANRVRRCWRPALPAALYVVVNVPAYELEVRRGGEVLVRKPVIVGKPDWPTPVFADEITALVLNPVWNVPESIAAEELVPKLKADPGTLAAEDLILVTGRGQDEREVDPAQIDWATVDAEAFPYRLRQRPGAKNLLGRLKFSLPNRYNVYLHDTPGRQLFARSERALSHGCVRVKDPFEVAEPLLAELPAWQGGRLWAEAERGTRLSLALPQPVPVFFLYDTAQLRPDGGVRLLRDLYGFDPRVTGALLAGRAAGQAASAR